MQKNTPNEVTQKEKTEELEPVKFGYGASIVFLIFITFVIYVSVKG